MDHTICPGARFLRQPRPEIFECPDCGEEVEIWSDEVRGTCGSCGRHVFRDGLPSCVEWCKYGEECVGEEAFGRYQRSRALGLKHRLLEVLQRRGLIDRAEAAARERAVEWAEAVLAEEPAPWHLVIPAVLVHDVALQPARREDSLEGLLQAQGLNGDDVAAVRGILEELSGDGGTAPGLEARIVHDAWTLAKLNQEGEAAGGRRPRVSADRLSTPTANKLAREHLRESAGSMEGVRRARLPGMAEEPNA